MTSCFEVTLCLSSQEIEEPAPKSNICRQGTLPIRGASSSSGTKEQKLEAIQRSVRIEMNVRRLFSSTHLMPEFSAIPSTRISEPFCYHSVGGQRSTGNTDPAGGASEVGQWRLCT